MDPKPLETMDADYVPTPPWTYRHIDIPGTLKLTASLQLKMDGWNTIISF